MHAWNCGGFALKNTRLNFSRFMASKICLCAYVANFHVHWIFYWSSLRCCANYAAFYLSVLQRLDSAYATRRPAVADPHETMLNLAARFGVSRTIVSNIFITVICAMHGIFFKCCMNKIPSKQKTMASLPECFSLFSSCRQIFDCTEIAIEVPRQDLTANRMTYSSYKSKNTFKDLISVSPNGAIVFYSDLFTVNTSDKQIIIQSGVLQTLELGDLILADKGFLIHDILPPGATVNLPSFLPVTRQFSLEQVCKAEQFHELGFMSREQFNKSRNSVYLTTLNITRDSLQIEFSKLLCLL